MRYVSNLMTLAIVILLSFVANTSVFAQNMATESYNPDSPWHKADETGFYSMQQCDVCSVWIETTDIDEADFIMAEHKEAHSQDTGDDGDTGDNGSNIGGSTSSGSNNGFTFLGYASPIIDVYNVGYALDQIGICDADWFVNQCLMQCNQLINGRYLVLGDLHWCIMGIFSPSIGYYGQFTFNTYLSILQLKSGANRGIWHNGYIYPLYGSYTRYDNINYDDIEHEFNTYVFN